MSDMSPAAPSDAAAWALQGGAGRGKANSSEAQWLGASRGSLGARDLDISRRKVERDRTINIVW